MMAAEATNYRGATDGLWGTATAAFLDTMTPSSFLPSGAPGLGCLHGASPCNGGADPPLRLSGSACH